MVAWSALVGSGRLWSALVGRSDSVRGSGGCLVDAVLTPSGRRRRCSIVNRSRSDSVRGSGGCLVGSGRLWSGVGGSATLLHGKSQAICSVRGSGPTTQRSQH